MRRCTKLEPTDSEPRLTEIIHSADSPVAGTVATYRCEFGVSDGIENRTCGCDGEWLDPVPECGKLLHNTKTIHPVQNLQNFGSPDGPYIAVYHFDHFHSISILLFHSVDFHSIFFF